MISSKLYSMLAPTILMFLYKTIQFLVFVFELLSNNKMTKSQKHHSVSNIDPRDTSGSKKIEDNDDDKESFP